MALQFIAKDPDSQPEGSPTLYRTDRKSWVVQGWVVTDPEELAQMNIPSGETCCEIPDRLVPFFMQEQEE
jgi:hypothetical protein